MPSNFVQTSSDEDRPLLAEQHRTSPRYDGSHSDMPPEPRAQWEKTVEERLLWKLDLRMTILLLIYILNFNDDSVVDRNSTAAARLRGFEEDLKLEKAQFASILSAFFVGYVLMQVPENMILVYVGKPSVYIPCATTFWGAISFCTGLATNYYNAFLARFLLGIVEAGFYPGAVFIISKWYRRDEISQRTAFLTCGIFIGEAFGALIASGILDLMDGVLGYAAWRWLFFVEGGLTVLVAIIALFIAPDFPEAESISWLTPEEHELARQRMIEDADSESSLQAAEKASTSTLRGFISAVSDWKVWGMALAMYFSILSVSFSMYFPTIASTIGFDAGTTLLLCIPPWLFATVVTLWVCRHSDRTGERCMHVAGSLAVGIIGFLLSMSTMNPIIRYFSMFLMAQMNCGTIGLYAWASVATSGSPSKRAVALALVNTFGQSSNIVGAYFWVEAWGPTYNKSFALCVTASLASIATCLFMRTNFRRLNREMDMDDEVRRLSDNDSVAVGKLSRWRYHT